MRNLLALAAAAAITFIVLGYFLGWYEIKKTPTADGTKYEVEVHNPKITQDLNKGKDKLRTWISNAEQDTSTPSQQTTTTVRPSSEPPTNAVPAAFQITGDGVIIYPGSPTSTPPKR